MAAVITIACAPLLVPASPALGFGTVGVPPSGQNQEHEYITRAALACAPGERSDECFEPRSLRQLAGAEGLLGAVGAPDIRNATDDRAHCDGADFLAEEHQSAPYPRSRQQADEALQACIAYLRAAFQAGQDAARETLGADGAVLRDETLILEPSRADLPEDCTFVFPDEFDRAKCAAIGAFGQILHGVQDFYSHSNWTDTADPQQPISRTNPPGLGLAPPADILDLRIVRTPTAVPGELTTGCFPGPLCPGRIAHGDLNKDKGDIDPLTGEASDPRTPRGRVGDNFARAVHGAIVETRRQWLDFRAQLVEVHGPVLGERMICAVTRDEPWRSCDPVGTALRPLAPYDVVEVAPSGSRSSRALAVNDDGLVVGQFQPAATNSPRPFAYERGRSAPLEPVRPPVAPFVMNGSGYAAGVNRNGVIVGETLRNVSDPDAAAPIRYRALATSWSGPRARGVSLAVVDAAGRALCGEGETRCAAADVNDAAEVAGTVDGRGAFVAPRPQSASPGRLLPGVGTERSASATSINDQGLIGGTVLIGGLERAAIWTDRAEEPVTVRPEGAGESRINAIADGAEGALAVGSGSYPDGRRAFVVHVSAGGSVGAVVPLPMPEGLASSDCCSEALGVNRRGDIVGWSSAGRNAPRRAVLWRDLAAFDLNEVIPGDRDAWVLTEARAVNEHGDIAGVGRVAGAEQAFLLQPRPLVMVPGAAGSRLVLRPTAEEPGSVVWPLCLPNSAAQRSLLSPDPRINPRTERIAAVDVLRRESCWLPVNVHGTMLETLVAGGYRELPPPRVLGGRAPEACEEAGGARRANLFPFAYDFRRSYVEAAARLATLMACIGRLYPGGRVDVVTHSAGALVARRYLLDHREDQRIGRLVTFGAPWLGAPKTINSMRTGCVVDFVLCGFPIDSMTGPHGLLPAEEYFQLTPRDLWPLWRSEELERAKPLTFDEMLVEVDRRFPASSVERRPSATLRELRSVPGMGDWREDRTPTEYHGFYGVQARPRTIGAVVHQQVERCVEIGLIPGERYSCRRTEQRSTVLVEGDKTVPTQSLRRIALGLDLNPPGAHLYRCAGDDARVEHVDMIKDAETMEGATRLLQTGDFVATSLCREEGEAVAQGDQEARDSFTTGDEPGQPPDWHIEIHGADDLTVSDTRGNSIARRGGEVLGELPGVLVTPTDDASTSVAVPEPAPLDPYTIDLVASEAIESVLLRRSGGLTGAAAIRYLDLDLPTGRRARLTLSGGDPPAAAQLLHDADGDGVLESLIAPTATASGVPASDDAPPSLRLCPASEEGKYAFEARDASGVASVRWSTDGAVFQRYTGPFEPPAGTQHIDAFADDVVANRSPRQRFAVPPAGGGLAVDPAAASEGDGAVTFTVALDCAAAAPVTLSYAVTLETAGERDVPPAAATVTIPSGQMVARIVVPVSDDGLDEEDETFRLEVAAPEPATGAAASAVGTIRDDDEAPTIDVGDTTVVESDGADVAVEVEARLSAPSGRPVSARWTTSDGNAVAGDDYRTASGVVAFAPGQTIATIRVAVSGDVRAEGPERLFVGLGLAANATVGTRGTIVVLDDDAAPPACPAELLPTVELVAPPVTEGSPGDRTTLRLSARLNCTSSEDASVRLTVAGGSATAGVDYLPVSRTVRIPAGSAEATIDVLILGDALAEGDETIRLRLDQSVGLVAGSPEVTATIADDEAASRLVIGDATLLEGSLLPMRRSVRIDVEPPSQDRTELSWRLVEGGATSGEDFLAASGSAVLAPGQRQVLIPVEVLPDTAAEGEETLTLAAELATGEGAPLDDAAGTLRISDDDAPAVTPCDRSTVRWSSSAPSASWRDARNWAAGRIPGPDDVVCIPTPGTVSVDGDPVEVAEIQSEGSLSISGTLHLSDPTGGSVLGGQASLAPGGALRIDGRLTISGELQWQGVAGARGGGSRIAGPGSLIIDPGGRLDATGGACAALQAGGGGGGPPGCLALELAYLESFGTLHVASGTIVKENGGGIASAGTIRLGEGRPSPPAPPPGNVLALGLPGIATAAYGPDPYGARYADAYSFLSTGTIDTDAGPGLRRIEAADLRIAGTVTIRGGDGPGDTHEGGLLIAGRSTAHLSAAVETEPYGVLDLRGTTRLTQGFALEGSGTLAAVGTVTAETAMDVPALRVLGALSAPEPIRAAVVDLHPVAPGYAADFAGQLEISGRFTAVPGARLGGGTVTVAPEASAAVQNLTFRDGAQLVNHGTIEVRSAQNGGRGTLVNTGRLRLVRDDVGQAPVLGSPNDGFRLTNTETGVMGLGATVPSALVNGVADLAGRVEIPQGTLQLTAAPGSAWTAQVVTGSTATLDVAGGAAAPLRLAPPFVLAGGGRLRMRGGVRVEVPLAISGAELTSAVATFVEPATVGDLVVQGSQVAGGRIDATRTLAMSSASLQGGSTLTVGATATGDVSSVSFSGDAQLINKGRVRIGSATGLGTITNEGELALAANTGGTARLGGSGMRLVNADTGLITSAVPTGFISGVTDLGGRVTVASGALQLASGPAGQWDAQVLAGPTASLEVLGAPLGSPVPLTLAGGFSLTGGARLRIGGVVRVAPALTVPPRLELSSAIASFEQPVTAAELVVQGSELRASTIAVNGRLTIAFTTLAGGSQLTLGPGGSGEVQGVTFREGSRLVNDGVISVRGGNAGLGVVTNNGTLRMDGTPTARPTLGDTSAFQVVNSATGTIESRTAAATMGGVTNAGMLRLGAAAPLAVSTFAQQPSGSLEVELGVSATPALTVRQAAVFDGALSYALGAGVVLAPGTRRVIIAFASGTGRFIAVGGEPEGDVVVGQGEVALVVDG
jgi:hypothetical protein